jgi:predicted nucleotidyltransferase
MNTIIQQHKNQIQTACKDFSVDKLYLFGSASREELKSNSDIDFLVSFKENLDTNYFDNYFDFQFKLEEILNRNIDLISENTLKNPYLIKSIDADKIIIYGE